MFCCFRNCVNIYLSNPGGGSWKKPRATCDGSHPSEVGFYGCIWWSVIISYQHKQDLLIAKSHFPFLVYLVFSVLSFNVHSSGMQPLVGSSTVKDRFPEQPFPL